mgnify:CR=1 FL=1
MKIDKKISLLIALWVVDKLMMLIMFLFLS